MKNCMVFKTVILKIMIFLITYFTFPKQCGHTKVDRIKFKR